MNMTIYKQLDSRWSGLPYPTRGSSFGATGCGCCACTHIAIEQSSKAKWTPATLRPWMVKQGYAYVGQGTTWQGITETLKYIGHKEVVCVWNDPMTRAWKELNKGNRIGILLVDNSKTPDGTYWTASGHYVAFTDYKVSNDKHYFYIKDSGGRNHDGWFCYEKSIKGALPKLWIVERLEESTPVVNKGKAYSGEYPDINRKKRLIDKAVELAWPKGTDSKKYAWQGGTSTKAFKTALNKVFPDRSSWGKAAKVGCSCDVFAGTCIRSAGLDTAFPRGLEQQFDYVPKNFTRAVYKNVKPADKSKDGDVVLFDYAGNGAHVVIRGNGMYYEAGYQTTYGHVNTSLSRLKKSYPKVVILRPKNDLSKEDRGADVKLLQKYMAWFGYKITVDGYFGSTTNKLVKQMQTKLNKEGLYEGAIDGIVGVLTLAAMKKYTK